MKQILIAVLVFHIVAAKPINDKDAEITTSENFNDGLGNYRFAYQTTNGIIQEQAGELITTAEGGTGIATRGFYSFVAPDNTIYEVRYVSDENGYQPQISVIPPNLNSASFPNSVDLNRPYKVDLDNDKTLKPTSSADQEKRLSNNEGEPCVPTLLNKSSTEANLVETSTAKIEHKEDMPSLCATTAGGASVKFNVDDRLGKAVMISILGTGG